MRSYQPVSTQEPRTSKPQQRTYADVSRMVTERPSDIDWKVRIREEEKDCPYAKARRRDQVRPYPKERSLKLDWARPITRDRTPDRKLERSSERFIPASHSSKRDIRPYSMLSNSTEEKDSRARPIITGRRLPPLRVTFREDDELQPPRKVRKLDTHVLTRNQKRKAQSRSPEITRYYWEKSSDQVS
ncbi:hypothetical protein DPMN_040433 [Dreissena polymorpha]|uniref:Uncharacterized protein n=1 Tax=Dreissena polymorpha TaxID=45954 RepID=A0A9D4CWQ2_DREPO|nr:hypothetical protein DPMN_040433 [Dreissena polymorpha]